jgi:hypothetical protein
MVSYQSIGIIKNLFGGAVGEFATILLEFSSLERKQSFVNERISTDIPPAAGCLSSCCSKESSNLVSMSFLLQYLAQKLSDVPFAFLHFK